MALIMTLLFKTPLRKLVILSLDWIKRGRGPVVVKIQEQTEESGMLNPTDKLFLGSCAVKIQEQTSLPLSSSRSRNKRTRRIDLGIRIYIEDSLPSCKFFAARFFLVIVDLWLYLMMAQLSSTLDLGF